MGYKKPIENKVKVGKLDFVSVARKSGLTGITTKKFQDKATEALHQAGFNKSNIRGILSGSRKMEHTTLKNVFNALRKADLSYKGGGAVKEYVTKEKNKQLTLVRRHLRERADEIKEETEIEKSATLKTPETKLKGNQSTSDTSVGAMGQVEKIQRNSGSAVNPSYTHRKAIKNIVPMPEQDQEIKALLDDAESHDLPID